MSEIAVKVEALGKKFSIGHQRSGDLRNVIGQTIRNLFRNDFSKNEDFWALRDLSFEIKKGEVVGIIGRNGAGKSTLLKILSRITEPTTGRFEIDGRVSSLLEVGTGFHPELTGRENVFLNGTILGMRREEIRCRFDEIVAFSGVEIFIDTPVKHYSSGMKVRLAFSVAAHLEPEILIIDEVLAVGDAEFQKKCLGKMDEVSKRHGRTILFVSHNMAAVQSLCNTGLFLNNGQIEFEGPIQNVIDHYIKEHRQITINGIQGDYVNRIVIREPAPGRISIFKYGEDITFDFFLTDKFRAEDHNFGFFIMDAAGNKIGAASTIMKYPLARFNHPHSEDHIRFTLMAPPLIEGDYTLDISVTNRKGERLEYLPCVGSFSFVATDIYGTGAKVNSHFGKIYFDIETSFYTKEKILAQ